MDIAILGDTSKSMKKYHRRKLVALFTKTLDAWGVSPEGNHYGLITFDRYAKIHNYFSTSRYHNKRNLISKANEVFNKVPRSKDWGTRSDIALVKAEAKLFTKEGGDRPDAKNLLFMLTDGKPYIIRKDRKKKPFVKFEKTTKALEVSKLQFNRNTWEEKLKIISIASTRQKWISN